jgi:hypothetical protein
MNRSLRMNHCSRLTALALVVPAVAYAATDAGGAPGEWLSRYGSARSVGLGNAYVATADAPMSAVWNAAALGMLDQNEVLFETGTLFEDTAVHAASFAVPGRWLPSLGFSIVALRSGGFERTNELNESLGTFENGETAFLFTTAKHFGTRFALGGNFKLVHQSVEDFSASGFGVDLGGLVNLTPDLRLGASLLNVAGPSLRLRDTDETFPVEMRGGVALRLMKGRGLISAEVDDNSESPVRLHAGAEYWIQHNVGLRVGYDEAYAAGGMSYRIAPHMRVDYGVSDHVLGLAHRLGFSYRFGGFHASAQALPVVFSPTGDQPVTRVDMHVRTKSEADRWTLQFVDASDRVVRQFGGAGVPPTQVLWDGKDENGLPLADGVYRYNVVVYDRAGRVLRGVTRQVEISTGGPQGSVPVDVR